MSEPVVKNEIKKPQIKNKRPADKAAKQTNVRRKVNDLIEKVLQENAPTWQELAKR